MVINNTPPSKLMDKIYKLIDPNTLKIRYIGKTNTRIKWRLSVHICEAKKGLKTHKCNWIRSLLSEGKKPIVKLVKKCKPGTWQEWEVYFIAKYKRLGHPLTNQCPGGEGGPGHPGGFSEQHRINSRLSKMGSLNYLSVPIRGTCLETGKTREFVNAREAQDVLRSEGKKVDQRNIRGSMRKAKTRGKYTRANSGGYSWEIIK